MEAWRGGTDLVFFKECLVARTSVHLCLVEHEYLARNVGFGGHGAVVVHGLNTRKGGKGGESLVEGIRIQGFVIP